MRKAPEKEKPQPYRRAILEEAVSEILQAVSAERGKEQPYSYFFMCGAGLSAPSIPLVSEITRECQDIAKRLKRDSKPEIDDPLSIYSHWFSQAYPHPAQRADYLQQLIANKPITEANFRLAHILSSGLFPNIVLTTNFDDQITKALHLLGSMPLVADHPLTVSRLDPRSSEPLIVHVHGSYRFYDCCNLRGEVEDRAALHAHSVVTMASWIDSLLSNHVPLVLGYSGWENDVFMTSLFRRLANNRLPVLLYWFCYEEHSVSQLPSWLLTHPDVVIVTERGGKRLPDSDEPDILMPNITASERGSRKKTLTDDERQALPAHDVLRAIVLKCDLKEPLLTQRPLEFFAKQLDKMFPKGGSIGVGTDIYFIKSVIRRLNNAQRVEEATAQGSSDLPERVMRLVRQSSYHEAGELIADLNVDVFPLEAADDMLEALFSLRYTYVTEQRPMIAQRYVDLCERCRMEGNRPPSFEDAEMRNLVGLEFYRNENFEEALIHFEEALRDESTALELQGISTWTDNKLVFAGNVASARFRIGTNQEEAIEFFEASWRNALSTTDDLLDIVMSEQVRLSKLKVQVRDSDGRIGVADQLIHNCLGDWSELSPDSVIDVFSESIAICLREDGLAHAFGYLQEYFNVAMVEDTSACKEFASHFRKALREVGNGNLAGAEELVREALLARPQKLSRFARALVLFGLVMRALFALGSRKEGELRTCIADSAIPGRPNNTHTYKELYGLLRWMCRSGRTEFITSAK